MSFWIIAAAGAALVTVLLARALSRGASMPAEIGAAHDVQVYRDQLAEVERDVARGVLPDADATRVRTEISRRILAADAAGHIVVSAGGKPSPVVTSVIAVVLLGGSLALYWQLGAPGYGDLALQDRIARAEDMRLNLSLIHI